MAQATEPTRTRLSADERRRAIVEVAREEFAFRGLHGTSTERIAERAGVSQPYLFRLFGTKKELFIACVVAGFARTLRLFQDAAADVEPDEALLAMGRAYGQLLRDRTELLAQLQAYAACEDEEIQTTVRRGYAELYRFVSGVTGVDGEGLRDFFAFGMLMNVVAAMDLTSLDEPWAKDIVKGCLP